MQSLRVTSLAKRGKATHAKFWFFYIATAVARVRFPDKGRQQTQSFRVTSLARRGKATLAKKIFYIATAASRVRSLV